MGRVTWDRGGVFVLIVVGALLVCGVGWLINQQITVRLKQDAPALHRLASELTHDEQIADLTQRVVTLEARKP